MASETLSTGNIQAFAAALVARIRVLSPEAADLAEAAFKGLLDRQRAYERDRKAKQRAECPRDSVPGTGRPYSSLREKNKNARMRIEDFQPSEFDLAAARRAGLDEAATGEALAEFREWHADAEPQEWSWAFRGWCDRRLRVIAARKPRTGQGRVPKGVLSFFVPLGSPAWTAHIAAGSLGTRLEPTYHNNKPGNWFMSEWPVAA